MIKDYEELYTRGPAGYNLTKIKINDNGDVSGEYGRNYRLRQEEFEYKPWTGEDTLPSVYGLDNLFKGKIGGLDYDVINVSTQNLVDAHGRLYEVTVVVWKEYEVK